MVSTETIAVPEISCDACKTAIEGALTPLDGVRAAVVDIATKQVAVDFDASRIGRARLVLAIEEAGYHVPAES